jgi:hypothetical protein
MSLYSAWERGLGGKKEGDGSRRLEKARLKWIICG